MAFQKGHDPNRNLKGRPVGSGGGLKDYDRKKFQEMSDLAKDAFLKTLTPELRYRMAEGNPANNTDITTGGEPLILPATLINKNDTTSDTGASSQK